MVFALRDMTPFGGMTAYGGTRYKQLGHGSQSRGTIEGRNYSCVLRLSPVSVTVYNVSVTP